MNLPPIQWIAHVSAHEPACGGLKPQARTVELLVSAPTRELACQAANKKVIDLGFAPWAVQCMPCPGRDPPAIRGVLAEPITPTPLGSRERVVLGLAPETELPPKRENILENPAFFRKPITRPQYGRSITCDSCP